jgi:hypothetical protein
MASPELDQALLSKLSQGPEDRVGVDPEDRGQIPGRGQSLARTGFALGDGPADFGRHLLVEKRPIGRVDAETVHSAN